MVQDGKLGEIYSTLFDRIINGKIPPNTRLREDELAEEFHVSRTPIREVLRLLEQDDLIEITPKRGAKVYPFTVDDVEDIFEIRRVLEVLALEYAVPSLSIHKILELKDLVEKTKDTEDNVKLAEVDSAVHRYFIESSKRRRLINMLSELSRLLSSFRELGFLEKDVRQKTYEEHIELINALYTRDFDRAKGALEMHIRNSKIRVLHNIYHRVK
jgi:DNA-binding GntR family transcriptional regulator